MEVGSDELLATLAGMGFELDQCQAALHSGKVTVQSAVDWIIRGGTPAHQVKSSSIPTRATPSLSLRSHGNPEAAGSSGIPYPAFSSPPVGMENVIPASVEEPMATSPESDVVSRFLLSEEKREERDSWEKKKRQEDSDWFRENRRKEKEAKTNILREIQADREARKNRSVSPTKENVAKSPPKTTSPVKPVNVDECTLQIRLPSGKTLREKFSAQCTLHTVVARLEETNTDLPTIDLIQPFPHKTFSARDGFDRTLMELGLAPSAALIARAAQDEPPVKVQRQAAPDEGTDVDEAGRSVHGEQRDERTGQDPSPEQDEGAAQHRPNREIPPPGPPRILPDMADIFGQRGGPQRHVNFQDREEDQPGVVHGLAEGFNRREHHQHQWGAGHSLNVDVAPQHPDESAGAAAPDPRVVAAAALQRLTAGASAADRSGHDRGEQPSDKPIPNLSDLCFKRVLKSVEVQPEQQQTTPVHLDAIPAHVVVRLLDELKRSGTLRPKVLQLFLHCRLRDLSLDSYKYTTNELLHCVSRHSFLNRLSLAACPLITDQGLLTLSHLKRLQFLNLCNNWQVTDKVFHLVSDLPSLTTLVLEGTSVTDSGLAHLASGNNEKLCNLNLGRTATSDEGVTHLLKLPNLVVLGLEKTKVKRLSVVSRLSKLRSLNISRNAIEGASEFQCLQQLTDLSVLHVSQMEGLLGDAVLHYLKGLQLKQLTLPDRHTTTDEGLKIITGMPLLSLDLTDYIHITDSGVEQIGQMESLRKLSLSNVKLTDRAMDHIAGLSELVELDLGRTLITNTGAMKVQSLTRLQELSLAETKITSKLLKTGCLNKCMLLTHLNLSRTSVSSEGLSHLVLQKLTHLNLDRTYVTPPVEGALSRCPSLQVTRLNELRERPRFLDVEEEDGD